MQLGMIGLGRMRLMRGRHRCVVHDIHPETVEKLKQQGALGSSSLEDFVSQLAQPRAFWLMLPAAVVDQELTDLAPLLDAGGIVIDGGNSCCRDDIGRSDTLKSSRIHYVDEKHPR